MYRFKNFRTASGAKLTKSKLIATAVFSRTIWLAVLALAVLILTSQGQSPGASTQSNVIWLHYDYMVKEGADAHSHEPQPESIRMVVEAFRQHGITLHIDPQHTAIPEHRYLAIGDDIAICDDSVNFYDLKAQYFQPRGNHAWHYAIFGHSANAHSQMWFLAGPLLLQRL